MSDLALPKRACWKRESADDVFHTEALTGNDGLFLATHSPIVGFSTTGPAATSIEEPTEDALLAALSKEGLQHAFAAIEGEPGSGKSHLIRWLGLNWPENNGDIVLLLQRSDGSLEGALEQLKQKLPAEFADLFSRMGAPRNISDKGRVRLFFSNLHEKLHDDHYEEQPEDYDWITKWQPAGLLENPAVKGGWSAPERILKIIQGAGGERNSEAARFKLADIAELIDLTDAHGHSAATTKLRSKLVSEWVEYSDLLENGDDDQQIVSQIGDEIPETRQFVSALNSRLNDAIQHVIGISSAELKKLFKDVRSALAVQGKRLVLLLEDITSWQGLDHGLIDVLVTDAGTRQKEEGTSDVCGLVSVIGLTPDYVRELRGNYRDRVTHWVHLSDSEARHQDVPTLRSPDDRSRFVARYLAATRAGLGKISGWYENRSFEAAPPNTCSNCESRSACHQAFGQVDGVGLFPFTPTAIETFYRSLTADDAGHTRKTPRGLIQTVLKPTLDAPLDIERNQYPGPGLERPALEMRAWGAAHHAMTSHLLEDEDERQRLKRLLTFWGRDGGLTTEKDKSGELFFDGIPRTVFECFDLPWPGEQDGEEIKTLRPPHATTGKDPTDIGGGGEYEAPDEEGGSGNKPTGKRETPAPAPTLHPAPTRPKPRGAHDPRDIEKWRSDEKLENTAAWGRVLQEIISRFDHRSLGFDPFTWAEIFKDSTVRFEGMAQKRRGSFMIPPEDWVKDGLEAYACLADRDGMDPELVEFYSANLARLYDRLECAAQEFAVAELGGTHTGKTWRPGTSAAQVLLCRAWFRGAVRPNAPLVEQWQALFVDEEGLDVQSPARTEKWRAFLQTTNSSQKSYRDALRRAVSITQGSSRSFGLASGEAVSAFVSLSQNHEFIDLPEGSTLQTDSTLLTSLAERATLAERTLAKAMAEEKDRLVKRTDRAMILLRNQSPKAHLERVEATIEKVAKQVPEAGPNLVDTWNSRITDYRLNLNGKEYQNSLLDTLVAFSDPEDLPDAPPELLSCLVDARANALSDLLDTLKAGEDALSALAEYVRAVVGEDGEAPGGREEVKQTATKLQAYGQEISRICEEAEA